MTPKLNKGLGRKRDAVDPRDLVLEPRSMSAYEYDVTGQRWTGGAAPLPSHVDVFHGLELPIYDQGSLGSCTANAGVLYRRFLAQRFSRYSARDEDLSRLFLYYQERLLPWNNDVAADSGASIRDCCYVLAHTGACVGSDDPYVPANFASPVFNNSAADLVSAANYKIGAYHRIPDVQTARSVLASGYAILLGFTVYASFENIGSGVEMPMPQPGEPVVGGHAVVIRGYDDRDHAFFVQNSWGAGWGNRGCFWMPYAFLESAQLSQPDMWMMHLGAPWMGGARASCGFR